ncbi:unnamed protein product [Clonostachys rosea f. rosea IK726]|uniref:Uncharacterized protein n=1 Tax=Clonostachys rosea f. rosea IK726 TaxID=1349383 RepID=A0ACA9UC73_BIOOC|nr:unnamed protein product [Clonostachys rosea f. rosea IK726]
MALQSTEHLWPNAIRSRVAETRPYAKVVSVDGKIQDVTFADLENASNRAAKFLEQNCPEDIFVYMGPSDLRYVIWVLGAMKTGKCALYPSLANPVPANRRLFLTVGVKKFLYAPEVADMLLPLRKATEDITDAQVALSYSELHSKDPVDPYPFDKTWDEVKDVRFMALHTSGTSGHPKPIYWTHAGASIIPSFLQDEFSARNGTNLMRDLLKATQVFSPFPLFHMGGMGPAMASVFCKNTLVVPFPGTPLSPANVTAIIQIAECNSTVMPPSVLESLLTHPPALEVISKLDHVAYMGGPITPARGAQLAKHCKHLYPLMASTEGVACHLESSKDSSHFNTFKFADLGQRMEEMVPGLYELVFPRTKRIEDSSGFFHVYPHLENEYRTSDLYAPAGEDGWWVYRGRVDNWVVMSNGLKFDPTEMENQVSHAPNVKGVLVAGSHHFSLCMLVELTETPADEAQAYEEIWQLVKEANKDAPKFGRVPRELLLIAKPDKPFLRSAKGTIQRRLTITEYEPEIDELYNNVEKGLLVSGLVPIKSTQADDLVPFLTDLHIQTLDLPKGHTLSADDDLLSLGINSLVTLILLARLKASLRKHGVADDHLEKITPKLWYTQPTILQMASSLSTIISTTNGDAKTGPKDIEKEDVEKLLAKYTETVKGFNTTPSSKQQDGGSQTILLTGSTGSLGSYILSTLLNNPSVNVICLNRSPVAAARSKFLAFLQQVNGLAPDAAASFITTSEKQGRLTFVQAKLQEPQLGLSGEEYAKISSETTSIIHNAFPVNFLLSVASFEPAIQSLVNLLELASGGEKAPAVLFISSISAASLSSKAGSTIPEAVITPEQARDLIPMGYARAKYICESLLQTHATRSLSPVSVLRVGQICGPISGKRRGWNPAEWFPSLAISSKFLGAVPDSLGRMDINWVPVDKLAEIVSELSTVTKSSNRFVLYNVVNPQTSEWSDLLPALDEVSPSNLARLAPAEWIAKVEGSGKDSGDADEGSGAGTHLIHQNPALKLVDFYKESLLGGDGGAAVDSIDVDIKNLLAASEVARDLQAIQQGDMASWVEAWGL